jgi:putative nucleotidyltransferase with HDIG domain
MNSAPGAPLSIETARQLYERAGSGHDFDHALRVLQLARRIALAEGADPAIVSAAALLHDIGEGEVRKDHHVLGAVMAREILREQPPEFVDAVAHAIEAHRFRADPAPRTLEARVVSDADKLDAIGAIGVARVFAHAGSRGTALWRASWREIASVSTGTPPASQAQDAGEEESQPAADPGSLDAATGPRVLGAGYTPVHEYVYKLRRIPEHLYTSTARAIAAGRMEFMQYFFDRLDREMTELEGGNLG